MTDLTLDAEDYSLLTDLYQLTMIACYVGEEIEQKNASFELFVRYLPENFSYLIAMGLEQVLDYLNKLHFSPNQIKALQATGIFAHAPARFWQLLESAKFTGDVWAVSEGTAIFANEPILRVDAPLWQAQLVETFLLNTINYQTLIATKAARMRDAAGDGANLLEFGTRRAFSPQGAVWAVRAALGGGLNSTSNVVAALKLGQVPVGTMAHSLVMGINALSGSEDEAFRAFHRYFPRAPLLIDTYDTVNAATHLAEKVKKGEMEVTGVRIDSGDLVELSQKVRSLLPNTNIFVSGDLDEWEITRLKEAGATIDGYGLGTKLVTGKPVNGVYKLVEIDGIPTMKKSQNKVTYPGRKQIFRWWNNGLIKQDKLGLMTDKVERGEQSLLELVMKEGKIIKESENLQVIAQRSRNSVLSLSSEIRDFSKKLPLQVIISNSLQELMNDFLK